MDELILQPDEQIILTPGEGLAAGTQSLRIRVGTPGYGPNTFKNIEEILWRTLKHQHGNPTAIYRRGEESRLIFIVPETAKPDSFGFENQLLTTRSRGYKTCLADLLGWLPQHGDTLEFDGKTYTVQKTSNDSGTFYQEVGNYNIMIRIHVKEYS